MAYRMSEFVKDLAIFSAGGLLGPTKTRKMLAYAGRKGIQLAGFGAARAATYPLPLIPAGVQAATPYAIGAGLGVGALRSQPGQDLLAAAEEHARQSRILFERAKQEIETVPQQLEAAFTSAPVSPATVIPAARKRAQTKFNRAVKAGMAAVKKSTSNGKVGKITKPRAALAMVSKVISMKKKKKKAPRRGIKRRIYQAIGRYV